MHLNCWIIGNIYITSISIESTKLSGKQAGCWTSSHYVRLPLDASTLCKPAGGLPRTTTPATGLHRTSTPCLDFPALCTPAAGLLHATYFGWWTSPCIYGLLDFLDSSLALHKFPPLWRYWCQSQLQQILRLQKLTWLLRPGLEKTCNILLRPAWTHPGRICSGLDKIFRLVTTQTWQVKNK